MEKEDIDKRILDIANLYEVVDTSDLQGMLLALETMSGVHYETLYNKMAEVIIVRRIRKFGKELEKEFECDVDMECNINFKYR